MIKKYLFCRKALTASVILFTVLYALLESGLALIFANFIDSANITSSGDSALSGFWILALVTLLYVALCALVNYLRRYFRAYLFVEIGFAVKRDYFNKVLHLEPVTFLKKDEAHYLSRITNDLPTVINEYIMEFFNILLYLFQSIFIIAVAFYINWIIAFAYIVLSCIIILYTLVFEDRFSKIKKDISDEKLKNTSYLKSTLLGFMEIKHNFAESAFQKEYEKSVLDVSKSIGRWWKLEAIFSSGSAFLTMMLTLSSIILATLFYAKGYLSVGLLSAAIYLSTNVFNPISNLFEQITYVKSHKKLIDNVFGEVVSTNRHDRSEPFAFDELLFRNVSSKYETSNKLIFNNLNFNVKGGKKYLLVGESGVGKSSLMKVIMGLLEYEGSVTIDGLELDQINREAIYRHIAYVPQSSHIFTDTIRNNIDLLQKYSNEEIMEVIKKVKLDSFMQNKRLDTPISESVVQVSGGEKQRISIARALLKKPKILLLDEVTAALDPVTTKEIETVINSMDITTIYICHKASDYLLGSYSITLNKKRALLL